MGILRILFVATVVLFSGMFLIPEQVRNDVSIAIQDVTSLVRTKTRDLDKKHNLVERSKVVLQNSRRKVEMAVNDPLSKDGNRTLLVGVMSFLLGLELGGPFLGVMMMFGSTLVDFQQEGLVEDIADAVEEVIFRAWTRIKGLLKLYLV